MARAISSAVLLCLLLAALTLGGISWLGEAVVTNFLISVVAVIGIGVFIGNSGILSFGHVGFMGVAAYSSALLTMDSVLKVSVIPDLPSWVASITLPWPLGVGLAVLIAAVVSAIFGLPISRLPGYSAAIASLGVLIITNVCLLGARNITKGAQTFYGAPLKTTVGASLICAVIAVSVSLAFKESRRGLQLRASREDELAARAMGIDVERLRWIAWTLGAALTGLAGALVAHHLGAFSPHEFFFTQTFTLVAMLIVGGSRSVTGAVSGAALVTLLIEFLRRLEDGFSVGSLAVHPFFGLTQIGLGVALFAVMFFRREGLVGDRELGDLVAQAVRTMALSSGRGLRDGVGGSDSQPPAPTSSAH